MTTFGLEGAHYLSNGWTLKALVGHSQSDWYLNDAYRSTGVDPDTGNIDRYTRRGWDDESRRKSLDIFATGPFALLGIDHEATLGFNYERYRGGEQFSLFEPKHSLKLYGTYRPGGSPWRISTGMIANSAIDGTGEEGVREGSGYAIFNAQLGYEFTSNTSVALAVNNLTDRRYYARIGGLNSYNTYSDPRSVAVSLRARF
ncbi:hypothetical protein LCGC14_0026540 [marine sediment metagenome]|uniref:Uncharacterized protein n=1 Tax=marine sediment metagenome TaxID=412755 RepID=A0A0F9YCZ0_9ZZZZ|nr:TonB-dependent receptor [Halomonas sp.]